MPYTFSCKSRSSFLPPIITTLRQNRQNLLRGDAVVVRLESEKEGYKGKYKCEIYLAKSLITVDYHYENASRFPARIKAAAIALCFEGFDGTFEISHDKGLLIIRKLLTKTER